MKYCVILDQIRDFPDHNRVRAEQRFLLIKEYEDYFVKKEEELLGSRFRHKKATIKYCQSKEITLSSFYRWLRHYRRYGIEGLLPSFGSPEAPQASRFQRKPPSKRAIPAKIDIEVRRPLTCLPALRKIIQDHPDIPQKRRETAIKFLDTVIGFSKQKFLAPQHLSLKPEDIEKLEACAAGSEKNQSVRATAVLMASRGHSIFEIAIATGHSKESIYRWLRHYRVRGTAFLKTYLAKEQRGKMWQQRADRVVAILHTSPKTYGINRTAWTRPSLREAYRKVHGENLPWGAIPRIIKAINYTWRRAKDVLTSPDPEYKSKAQLVLDTLRGLGSGEAFFFVDEAGPWPVKKYGGKSLSPKWIRKTYPRFQKARGRVTFIAALDALENLVFWLFTNGKDTKAIIDIIQVLYRTYLGYSTLYLTWDSASWHKSKELRVFLNDLNALSQGPVIKVVPLPSRAQFLNVIESVIGGMKRAVVHNSDYRSEIEMQTAISMYFFDRNEYFWQNPKRAGDKMWDKERFNINEFESGLHKRM